MSATLLRQFVLIRHCALGLTLLISLLAPSVAQTSQTLSWPELKLPRHLQLFSIGQDMSVNGAPMRAQGFTSMMTIADTVQSVQESLGQPLVVNQLGKQTILGRAIGTFYVTVQIEQAGFGSRGVVAMTHVASAVENKELTQQDRQRWLDQLPSGSRLLSHVKSLDSSKQAVQIMYANQHDSSVNSDKLKSVLLREGLSFEREVVADNSANAKSTSLIQGKVLFFKGAAKEAIATIHREPDGITYTVLNIVSTMEKFK